MDVHPRRDQACERNRAVGGHLVGPLDGLGISGGEQSRDLVDGDVESGELIVPLRVDLGEGLQRDGVELIGSGVVGGGTFCGSSGGNAGRVLAGLGTVRPVVGPRRSPGWPYEPRCVGFGWMRMARV